MSDVRQNTPRESDPFQGLNDPAELFKNPYQLEFIRTLISVIRQQFSATVKRNQGSPQIILSAPNGTSWIVTVDNSGVLQTKNARA